MAAIKLHIKVSNVENVLTLYNRIKVYRSDTGIDGTYTEVTDASTRLRITLGIEGYIFDDPAGSATSYYKTSYYHTDTVEESDLSNPRLGEDYGECSQIITVDELKTIYLFGLDLTDDQGNEYPDLIFEWSIAFACDWVEKELDLLLKPTVLTQKYDYYRSEFLQWMHIQLREFPVISVEHVKMIWPPGDSAVTFDPDYFALEKDNGQLNIVPARGSALEMNLLSGGGLLATAWGRDFIPHLFEVKYTAGFENGQVPMSVRELVGKKASFGPLNIAGDLLGGAGIASQSIGLDGLSQSFNTTSSSTSAGYGARLKQYSAEIKEQLPNLRRYFKGVGAFAV